MKQSWAARVIFIVLCAVIILCLGMKRNEFILSTEHAYKKYELIINEVMSNNRNSIKDEDGDFEDWIEIYNKGDKAINLKGFGLSNSSKQPFLWIFPEVKIEPKSFRIVWLSEKDKKESGNHLHANFKLNNKDKALLLTAPGGYWNDIFILQPMGENISYGRIPDGGSDLYGFDEGTPRRANEGDILLEGPDTRRLNEPVFSMKGGFFTRSFDLCLTADGADIEIYYTLDGSVPTTESNHYTRPIPIASKSNEGTVVRARAYKDGFPKSEINTQSYFVDKDIYQAYNTPVISLVTDPKNLFDYEKGIYIAGKIYDQWMANHPVTMANQLIPANYNQKGRAWERDASIELFEFNGTVGFIQNVGIRIHGGYSRASNLKPLSLHADMDYDDLGYFEYDFFKENRINKYNRILLRTSATDSKYVFFRDAFIQSLVKSPIKLDTQASRPCILYINGKYYGIHNIREAYDKTYVSRYYHMDEEDIVIIKNPTGVAGVEIEEGYTGDEMHYNRVIAFIQEKDLQVGEYFDYIKTQIDIDNFIEYNILQVYCDNRDWPGNNVRIWRKRTQGYEPNSPYGHDGRWRWMIFDLDYGFGLYQGEQAAMNNSLARATAADGPDWPNPPWSTLLLRKLLENGEFRNQFINTFADRLNTSYASKAALEKIAEMEELYLPNVRNHIKRWNLHDNKVENWMEEIDGMKSFALQRPGYLRQHITDYFGLSGSVDIMVEVNEGGSVKLNTIIIGHSDTPWQGTYFKDIPITLEAIPEPGYAFVGWEDINKMQNRTISIRLSEAISLKAIFEPEKIR